MDYKNDILLVKVDGFKDDKLLFSNDCSM